MNFEKTHQNFYSMCINAIKENNDGIIDKKSCIANIEKLRNEKLYKKKKSKHRSINELYKPGPKRREIKSLQQILLSYNISNKKSTLPPIHQSQKDIELYTTNITNKKPEEKVKKLKEDLKPKKTEKKITMYYESKTYKNKPKRVQILKNIMEYLESNDLTLKDIIENNPFQKKPYEIPKSFEFLSAIKFKNYNYVIEALQHSNSYLFCFDYYGQTCYHWAAKLSNIKMLSILIDNGKYINQKDFEGRTPLYLAAVNNDKAICELLIRHKANVHLKDINGKTPADVATNKELRYYLGDLLTQPYSNPSSKQKIANLLREKENLLRAKVKMKKIEEKRKSIIESETNP